VYLATYRLQKGALGVDLGLQLGHLLSLGQFSVGVERGIAKARRKVGTPEFPDVDADTGGFTANLRLDQLDNFWFPREGWLLDVSFNGFATRSGRTTSSTRPSFSSSRRGPSDG
jgi:outer membrane translocation and assembly module TamA